MKKLVALILALCFLLSGCSNPTGKTQSDITDTTASTESDSNETSQPSDNELTKDDTEAKLDLISVTFNPDPMMGDAIVFIENNSDQIFTGVVYIEFYDAAGSMVGDASVYPEDLGPGNTTYTRIGVKSTDGLTMDYSFGKYCEFTDAASAAEATPDEETAQKIAEEMLNGFGGAGNPEWATSWYGAIEDYEAYTTVNGDKYAVVIVGDASEEDIDRIGNTVFANYAKEYGLAQVFVKDAAGTTLFTRSE